MMILTAASALLCTFMTGCTINVSDDAVSTAAEIAVSAMDDAEIKVISRLIFRWIRTAISM